ncbi:MAG: hypothetical protein R3C68_10600 [Myxococcota bacterium]
MILHSSHETGETHVATDDVPALYLLRPPFWSVGMIALASIASVYLIQVLVSFVPTLFDDTTLDKRALSSLPGLVFWLTVTAIAVGRRVYIRSKPLPPISFHADHIELPPNVQSSASRAVAYSEILSIHLGGQGSLSAHFKESKNRLFHFHQASFVDPRAPNACLPKYGGASWSYRTVRK